MKILTLFLFSSALLFGAIDINSASVSELTKLKGIGKSKAVAIVEYRKDNCFTTVDGLAKVKGIGKSTVDKNRSELEAGECKR